MTLYYFKIISKRFYGEKHRVLLHVNIFNSKTGVYFEDWIRSEQLRFDSLRDLILWDKECQECNLAILKTVQDFNTISI